MEKKPAKPVSNHRAISIITMIVFALTALVPAQVNATGTNPGDDQKQKTEAVLVTKIEQWLDGKPLAFEQRTNRAMTKGMHAMGAKMKAYEAQLQAEIDAMERLLGFKNNKAVAKNKVELIKPLDMTPIKRTAKLSNNTDPVPSLMEFTNKPE